MEHVSFTRKEVAEGKKLLAKVLAKIRREQSTEGGFRLSPVSDDATAMFAHLRVRNLKSIIIRQDKDGFWTGDLLLKRVPHGVPDVIGVPEHAPYWPYKTRRDALSMICLTVKGVYLRDQQGTPDGSGAKPEPVVADG